jgi:thiol-disulfide isomerase/thioredoxin
MTGKLANLGGRKYLFGFSVLVLALALVLGLAVKSSGQGNSIGSTEWQQIELKDVNSGETFTVGELEKPVLVESFAVWCSTCTRQQQEVKKFHEEADVKSVSLNVDSNEDENKIRQHTNQYDFNWRYAVSPPEMTRQLVNQFGNSMVHPPSAPMVLICENSTRKLPNGVKPVSKLQEEVDKGC